MGIVRLDRAKTLYEECPVNQDRCWHAGLVFRSQNAKKPKGSARRWMIASAYCQGLDADDSNGRYYFVQG
jgi:hypothetical protein